jgi:hypothetical protein
MRTHNSSKDLGQFFKTVSMMFSEIIYFLYSVFLIPFVLFPTFVGCTVKEKETPYVAAATPHFQKCFPFPSFRPCVAAAP